MGKEELKVKPIRRGLEYQKGGTPLPEREKSSMVRRKEIQQMLNDNPPRAHIEVLERDPKTRKITKYQVVSNEDGSVLAYENDAAFGEYLTQKESVTEQLRERTPKHKNMLEEIHPESPHSLLEELPGEDKKRGN